MADINSDQMRLQQKKKVPPTRPLCTLLRTKYTYDRLPRICMHALVL
jgi:hypothetical protein